MCVSLFARAFHARERVCVSKQHPRGDDIAGTIATRILFERKVERKEQRDRRFERVGRHFILRRMIDFDLATLTRHFAND